MRRLARAALAVACACASAAFANDTTARVAAGGIEPLESANRSAAGAHAVLRHHPSDTP